MIKHVTHIISLFLMAGVGVSSAQDQSATSRDQSPKENLSAYQAVHEGNRLLLEGDPVTAMDYYLRGQKLAPDARELAFSKGLGHYALQEYEDARQAFQQAALGKNNALTDDALYSLGTAYHTEALASQQDPQLALSMLESAMRQYHNVLANNPNHDAARDANRKAATTWRNIKQIMEQQQQQNQDSNQDQDKENEENDDPQSQKDQNQDQQNNQDQEQQQNQNQQENESENQDKQQQQSSEDDQQQEQQSEQEQQAQQQEQVSREQAERKLREMMQALRERKKNQREKKLLIPFRPVDKDW